MSSKFTHIGMNHVVQNDRVLAIILPQTATAKRYKEDAKKRKKLIAAELGREVKSLLIMDDGSVISSCIKPKTLMGRFNGVAADETEEDENEDH